jgi:hypothetical protein
MFLTTVRANPPIVVFKYRNPDEHDFSAMVTIPNYMISY